MPTNPMPAVFGIPHVTTTSKYRRTILAAQGLINYWALDEPSSLIHLDVVGGLSVTGQSGTQSGQPGLVQSRPVGYAMSATGAANSRAASAVNYAFPTTFSIECWWQVSSVVGNVALVSAWSSSAGAMLWLATSTGAISLYTNGTALASGFTPGVGQKCHVLGTYDGTNSRIYINGALVAGPTASPNPTASGSVLLFGDYNGSGISGFAGRLDEVAIYNRALTAAEAASHYAIGA